MEKFMKVVKVICIALVLIVGIAFIVGYIWFKDNTIEILNSLKDFLNQPLPIIGVSILTCGVFAYEIVVKFGVGAKTIKGIVSEKDNELARIKEKELEINNFADNLTQRVDNQDISVEELKGYIIELCSYIRNVKVQELVNKIKGDNSNGEQDQDSQANQD